MKTTNRIQKVMLKADRYLFLCGHNELQIIDYLNLDLNPCSAF